MPKLVLALSLPFLVALSHPRAASWGHEPVQADTQSVTFKSKAAAVGDKYTSTDDMLMAMTVGAGGNSINVEVHETEERKTEVVAVSDGLAKKIRVKYASHKKETRAQGKSKTDASPVSGKSYLVERKGEALVVTGVDGKPVSPAEEEHVAKSYKRLGKPDEITRTLKSKPRKVGEKLDDVAQALADQFKERSSETGEKATIQETKLVFTEVKKIDGVEHAVLDLTLKMGTENAKGVKLSMDLKGKVLVRVEEAAHGEINMSGPIKVAGSAQGGGTVTLKTKTGP